MLAKSLRILLAVAVVATAAFDGGCSRSKGRAVKVMGSTSIQPFAEMLAQEFNSQQSAVYVEVDGGGSAAGLKAADQHIANIGMCSRELKPDEKFNRIQIAGDGIAIVVNLANPVTNLTRQQIRDMFTGKITNWDQIPGGLRCPFRLITREEGSGTREAFTNLVMDKQEITLYSLTEPSNGSVKALVEGDKAAIGYMSLGQVQGVKAVDVDGITPTPQSVLSGKYPLRRPFLFVTSGEPTPADQKFIDFVLSNRGQQMLENEGLVRVVPPKDAGQ